MTIITKTSAKSFFITGAFPSQSNFADTIDSCIFSNESSAQSIPTLNITTKLSALAANITTVSANTVYATVGGMLTGTLPNPTFSMSPITNSLGSDVALNNTANYFDGPSIAQGTSGTWLVNGTVTLTDTAGAATFVAKLWDGTTVIDSGAFTTAGANNNGSIALSGYLATPAANLRISVRDSTSTSGKIQFNQSGNSKDSTISAIRIA